MPEVIEEEVAEQELIEGEESSKKTVQDVKQKNPFIDETLSIKQK